MRIKKIISSCLFVFCLCSVLTAQILMPDEEALKKEILSATGKNELKNDWNSFFKERSKFFQSETFNTINSVVSSNYYILEDWAGNVISGYSFYLFDEDNCNFYKYTSGKLSVSKLPNSYKSKFSKLQSFNNIYIQGTAARYASVNLSVSVKNKTLNWFLHDGSLDSKYSLGTKSQKKEIKIYNEFITLAQDFGVGKGK